MSNVIDSLLVALGFEVDASDLKEFEKQADEAKKTMLAVGTAAAAAAGAIGLFVANVAGGIDDLADWAEAEQVALDAVQEWGYAAQLNGSSLDAVKASISGINRVLGEAALGIGRGAMTFEKLGLSAKNAEGQVKSVDELLAEVSDRMQGMSRQEAIAMAEKLGIDRSLIPLLMKGREAFEEYRKEAQAFGIVSDEDAQKAGDFQDSMDRTRFMVGALTKSIAVELMPRLTELMDGFRKWVMANREVIKSSIGTAIKVVTIVIGRLWDVVSGLIGGLADAVKWLSQFEGAAYAAAAAVAAIASYAIGKGLVNLLVIIRSLTAAMGALNIKAMLLTGMIGAIALAVALVVDDFLAWKEGGDSVIGDLIEQFPWLEEVILDVEGAVRKFFGFLGELWNIVGPPLGDLAAALWDLVSTLADALWPVVKVVLTGWVQLLGLVLPVVAQIIGGIATIAASMAAWLTDMFTGFIQRITGIVDFVTGAAAKVKKFFGFGDQKMEATLKQVPATGGQGYPSLPTSGGLLGKAADQTNNSAVSTQTVSVSAPITINSPDPARAGQSVREELNRVNKQATRNGQTAVAL